MKVIIVSFALGLLLGVLLISQLDISSAELQIPYTLNSPELMSPSDSIKESQIHVYEKRIVIDIDAQWARIMDTNSMEPFLDKGANALQIIPKSKEDIHIGDVISYQSENGIIIHRVIAIEEDEEGIYYTLKGDNNELPDPVKVRFSDILRKLVGVLY